MPSTNVMLSFILIFLILLSNNFILLNHNLQIKELKKEIKGLKTVSKWGNEKG